ncbi:MAG: hypothetical protein JO255_16235, partial [Alphaproteobacteria bacterium]|nr:hypothetical protein [Alphaproteobacteria bacterium]
MRARLLAGSALIPAALALALPARADVIINGANQGNAVNIDGFTGSILLTGQNEIIGSTSNGSFAQPDGNNTALNAAIVIGNNAGVSGTYTLSGGTVSASFEDIGRSGSGTFTQNGGSNSIIGSGTLSVLGTNETAGTLIVGENPGSSGTYNLTAGTLSAESEGIGTNLESAGAFAQSGGTNRVSGALILGVFGNTNTTLNSSGTYTLSGPSTVTLQAGSETIGDTGNAIFAQSGGSNTIAGGGSLVLANGASSKASYTLSGGSLVVSGSSAQEVVGNFGTASFTQSGGSNAATALVIAANSGASGSYDLQAGTLTAGSITVNTGGTFKFDGGTADFGTLTIAGGAVTASGSETIGAAGNTHTSSTVNHTSG